MTRVLVILVLLTGCKNDARNKKSGGDDTGEPDTRPPEICNAATAGPAFDDQTDAWGLTDVHATRMSVADLDGDAFPDMVLNEGSPFGRDDFEAGTRYHWVLMNRDDGAGGRTFVDESVPSGLLAPRDGDAATAGRASALFVYADVDNDGNIDVFSGHFYDGSNDSTDTGDRSEIMLNNGDGTFSMASQIDLGGRTGYATAGASFVDVDADGNVDLWITGWYEVYGYLYSEQDRLFMGNGDGTFSDATEAAGLEMTRSGGTAAWIDGTSTRPAYGGTACDLDGDSLGDLLASNYARAWNQQWMNQGDGSFTDMAMSSGFSGDENLDYSDNMYYRCYCAVYGCDPDPGASSLGDCDTYAAYWSAGFDDTPSRLNGNTFSTACGDIDNDGDLDLMSAEISHWHIGYSSDPSELLLNDGTGTFSRPGNDADGLTRQWPSRSWNAGDLMVAMADLDADGWKDILLVTSDYPDDRMFLFHQVAPGQFEEVAEDAGVAHEWPAGLAVADFDLDGDLDVVTGSSTARSGTPWETHEVHFYGNQSGPGNTVRIALEGTTANRLGTGARVEVVKGDLVQVQEVSGGYGHMGMHHDTDLTFGLADACNVDEITVTWPGGAVDSWTDVRANYEVHLTQGGEITYAP